MSALPISSASLFAVRPSAVFCAGDIPAASSLLTCSASARRIAEKRSAGWGVRFSIASRVPVKNVLGDRLQVDFCQIKFKSSFYDMPTTQNARNAYSSKSQYILSKFRLDCPLFGPQATSTPDKNAMSRSYCSVSASVVIFRWMI